MISVRAIVTIWAHDDEEADSVWAALHSVNRTYPDSPVVNITETSREVHTA